MKEKNHLFLESGNEENERFTGMPEAKFPDFEPEQCGDKQMQQFTNSTESRNDEKQNP